MSEGNRVLILALLAAAPACIGRPRIGLLPRTPAPPPHEPTATLVTNPGAQRTDIAPPLRTPIAESASLSLATLLLWAVGGPLPLIGVFGTFDENRLVESPPCAQRCGDD